ncbi:hypothetical protein FOL47_010569 [Perkinsus chesapeaki]|uniref:SAP domain-containing protein n=1 Tax=Perkinsus chesapeaki TaxID=330153 RepID=A0A7J6L2G4_PERCH|nr:hypothetical protein FOL47_010569 [Perkinsus chesapeaki]
MPVTTRRASYEMPLGDTTDMEMDRTPVSKSESSVRMVAPNTAPAARRTCDTPDSVLLKRYSRHLSFNPGLLDNSRYWSEDSLRDLCRKLSLEVSGDREDLITRLRSWHEQMDLESGAPVGLKSYTATGGGNFWLISVKEALVASKFKSPFRRASAVNEDGTVKPILRRDSAYGETPSRESSGSAGEYKQKKRRSGSLEGIDESKAKRRTSICPPAKEVNSECGSTIKAKGARSSICEPCSGSKCATTGKKKKMRVQFSPKKVSRRAARPEAD